MLGKLRRQVSHENARELLDEQGFSCTRVIQVDRDSILYLNGVGKPRTLWLHVPQNGPLRCQVEPGFAPEPPPDWHRRRSSES